MPKIRALHPGFWNDTTVAECSSWARLLYMGLWNFADDAGVFEYHDRLIKSQIFPFDDDIKVEKLLNELLQHNRIKSFIHNDKKYGLIINFTKYQRPDSRYVRYTIGDYEHVKNISHIVNTSLSRRVPPTDGDGDGDGVIVSDAAAEADSRTEIIDEKENEFRQFIKISSSILGQEKKFTKEGLKKWKTRRVNFSAQELEDAISNISNEPDHWKIKNVGKMQLSWWLKSDDYIRELQSCHLKASKGQILFAG